MSDNKVILNYDGNSYEYPIVESTIGDRGIDISKLRDQTGLITLDLGYKNTGATLSNITYLDGDKEELFYRGYPIEQIAEKSNFTEVMYLLLQGELPTQEQFGQFQKNINNYNYVAEEMKKIIDAFPRSAHPMGVLSTLTSALTAFNPKAVNVKSKEDLDHAAEMLIAKFSHLCAWTYRKTLGLPINHGDNSLNYVENFYKMTFRLPNQEFELDPVVVDALDKILILHADHEQNCSTSTVRMVGSAQTGLFASISAGVSALWGPLHGGANQAVIEMLEHIEQDGGDVAKYVAKSIGGSLEKATQDLFVPSELFKKDGITFEKREINNGNIEFDLYKNGKKYTFRRNRNYFITENKKVEFNGVVVYTNGEVYIPKEALNKLK